MSEALATQGPVVVEAMVDPNESPMPSKIKPKQALHLAKSLAKETPNRMKIISTVAEDQVREMV